MYTVHDIEIPLSWSLAHAIDRVISENQIDKSVDYFGENPENIDNDNDNTAYTRTHTEKCRPIPNSAFKNVTTARAIQP